MMRIIEDQIADEDHQDETLLWLQQEQNKELMGFVQECRTVSNVAPEVVQHNNEIIATLKRMLWESCEKKTNALLTGDFQTKTAAKTPKKEMCDVSAFNHSYRIFLGAASRTEKEMRLHAVLMDTFLTNAGWKRYTDIVCGVHYANCIAVRSGKNLRRVAAIEYLRCILHNYFDVPLLDQRITGAEIDLVFFETVEAQMERIYNGHVPCILGAEYKLIFEREYHVDAANLLSKIVRTYFKRLAVAKTRIAGIVEFAAFSFYLTSRCNAVNTILLDE